MRHAAAMRTAAGAELRDPPLPQAGACSSWASAPSEWRELGDSPIEFIGANNRQSSPAKGRDLASERNSEEKAKCDNSVGMMTAFGSESG